MSTLLNKLTNLKEERKMFRILYDNGKCVEKAITNDAKDLVQILIGLVNDENIEKNAYEWCGNASWGDTYTNLDGRLEIKCVYDENNVYHPSDLKHNTSAKCSARNEEIIRKLRSAADLAKRRPELGEYHLRFYDDGTWYLELERFKNGLIRFWVGFEYKDGRCKSSLVTVYRDIKSNNLKWAVDGIKIKQKVLDKLLSVAVALEKACMIKL